MIVVVGLGMAVCEGQVTLGGIVHVVAIFEQVAVAFAYLRLAVVGPIYEALLGQNSTV